VAIQVGKERVALAGDQCRPERCRPIEDPVGERGRLRTETGVKMGSLVDLDLAAPGADRLVDARESGEELGALFARGFAPGAGVPPRDENRLTVISGKLVPEAKDPGSAVEDELGVGLAEGAGDLDHRA
jgi:hypothetical protein